MQIQVKHQNNLYILLTRQKVSKIRFNY